MRGTNYGPDQTVLEDEEQLLSYNMKKLMIFNAEEAFSRCTLKYAHTSNDGYGGFVEGINSAFDMWFETTWDSHYTVAEFENGEVVQYSFC